ncbi:hypothetical protein BCR34DRAFT_580545 [Clohesyomyces aquaticus]|uniref:Uncharacterized protein n=1 Tax=Clohesyomyces aquaticus TaxID=1231657 RepID=A0A1Y1Y5Y7_9PLEO|nr:hypothetical protein BCR34DRAFT_580545 [Clohesyomyces aquaticus]
MAFSPNGLWYPMFVTADIPVETINTILTKASKEQETHDQRHVDKNKPYANYWVLVKSRNQTEFETPTNGLVEPFENDFVDTTVQELCGFVQENFGEDGKLHNGVSDNFFGLLDARTARDQTLVCMSDCLISLEDKARIRVSWGLASREDEALVRYSGIHGPPTNEDVAVLLQGINVPIDDTPLAPILSHELQMMTRETTAALDSRSLY